MFKRTITLLISAMLLIVPLAACGQASEKNDTATTTAAADATTETTAPTELKDSVPALDFKGFEIKILNTIQDNLHYMNLTMESLTNEETGEVINDAAYRRSIEIQERFNCKVKQIDVANGSRVSLFRTSALAGDNAYDIGMLLMGEAHTAFCDQLVYDINELAYIDLDMPWWDQNAKKSMSIANKVYFCPGAYELSNMDMTRILLFNKKMMKDYGINEDIYKLVLDGKWTQAKLYEMAKLCSKDVNGDGKYDFNDLYGLGSTADHVVFGSLFEGANEMLVKKDKDDMPYFAAGSERFNKVIQSLSENLYVDYFYFYPKNVSDAEVWCTNMFDQDRVLFYNITFNRIPKFRNMNADFGVLPIPKYEESQENYHCESGAGAVALIPASATDPDRTAAFLEAYAYYGYKYVVPAYKEVALKTKLSRDNDSAAMVDIIDESRVYDLGRLYWAASAYDPYVALFGEKSTNVASVTERQKAAVETAIAKTVTSFVK